MTQSATFTICDQIEVFSPEATTVELPFHVTGSVFAAESFGDPNVTRGYAKLELSGSMAGASAGPLVAEAESESVIPTQVSINESRVLTVDVPAGITTFSMTFNGSAEMEATAQCAGFFCLLTGSATCGIDFPGSIEVGNFTGPGGGPLPKGTIISSLISGGVYVGADEKQIVGDINCDGTIDLLDVAPFINILTSGQFAFKADINGDGVVSLLDVAPFVELLIN